MKAVELKKRLERLIADFGEDAEIEISVDISSDEKPYERVFANPIDLQVEASSNRHVILAECTGYAR